MSRFEFRISIVALVAVLLLGILKGVLFAAIASLLMLLAGAARPHVAFLGRIPGTRRYSDLERHPDNEAVPGVVIFRTESSLLYFNAEHVRQVVWDKLQATPELRLVVCDLSDAPVVDVAGASMLAGLHRDLTKREVRLRVVEAHAKVRDMLRPWDWRSRSATWAGIPPWIRSSSSHRRPSPPEAVMPVAGNIGPGRPCCRQVATTVNIRSANRLPNARSVPPLMRARRRLPGVPRGLPRRGRRGPGPATRPAGRRWWPG